MPKNSQVPGNLPNLSEIPHRDNFAVHKTTNKRKVLITGKVCDEETLCQCSCSAWVHPGPDTGGAECHCLLAQNCKQQVPTWAPQ